jgi:hypothetical protein
VASWVVVDEGVEQQSAQGAEDCGDMAVGTGADDIEGLRQGSAESRGALEDGTKGIDLSLGPMREIGEGAVADFAVEAEGLTEEDGGRGEAVGDGGHVHAYRIRYETTTVKHNIAHYMTT